MKKNLQKLLTNRISLITISCILGYSVWYTVGIDKPAQLNVQVPLCFYGQHEQQIIKAPQYVDVRLSAPRRLLYALDSKNLAVHFDANKLSAGKNSITITRAELLLPKCIKLLDYKPINIVVDSETHV